MKSEMVGPVPATNGAGLQTAIAAMPMRAVSSFGLDPRLNAAVRTRVSRAALLMVVRSKELVARANMTRSALVSPVSS